ncbi:MAG: GAF domain-containing protein [Chloroflexi bacterium]|nr:GAF domain-containing protein [Chloroflexota bacterium]
MINVIIRTVRIQHPYDDPGERQQAQRLLAINLVWLVAIGLSFLVYSAYDFAVSTATLFFPLSLFIAGLSHWLLQHGQLHQARFLFVLNILAATFLSIFPDYRIDTPFLMVLVLPLVAAGLLLRRRGLLLVTVFLMATVTVGGYLQYATDMEPTSIGSTDRSIQVTILLFDTLITLTAAMLWFFTANMEETLRTRSYLSNLIDVTARTSQTLVGLPTSGEELNHFVEELQEALDLYHIQIFLSDPTSGLPVLQASTGYMGRRLLEEHSLLTPEEDSPINDALRRKDPLVIGERAPEKQRSGFLPATRSQLLLPLRVGELLPFGVLDLHSSKPDDFTPQMLNALVPISHQLAVALYSSQQTTEVRSSYQERDQLIEQIDATQRELARINRQLIGVTWGTYLEDRQHMVPGFEWQQGQVAPSEARSETIDQILADGQARLEQRDGEHVLCVPIRLRGQTLGALEFKRSGQASWSAAALELAQAVAERLALSLENARLFEQAQTTARREQLVSQVTTRLQTTNDLTTLLTLAAEQFQGALGATHTQVRLGQSPSAAPVDDEV